MISRKSQKKKKTLHVLYISDKLPKTMAPALFFFSHITCVVMLLFSIKYKLMGFFSKSLSFED